MLIISKSRAKELLKFINELNKMHKTIKFDFRYSKLETNNQQTFYKKPTYHRS